MASNTAAVANAIAHGIMSTPLFNNLNVAFLNTASNSALSASIVTMVNNSSLFEHFNTAGVLAANASADAIGVAVAGMFANSPFYSTFNYSPLQQLGD
jgi:hypothetical protein